MKKAYLVLEDGSTFCGESFGLAGEVTAEVVFSTGMTGYLETLTDKSYFGQIVVQTFPLIGNYGVIPADFESDSIGPKGYIVKEWCQVPSNFRSEGDLDTFFKNRGVIGLCGIDTRAVTKIIREKGVMNGAIVSDPAQADLGKIKAYRIEKAVESVSTKTAYAFNERSTGHKVALIDLGYKKDIAQELSKRNIQVTVCPYNISADEIQAMGAQGILISNGPGDPKENTVLISNLKDMIKLNLPMFGVCLGHQVLALANGFDTSKLKFGHRGANQPVKNLETGRVYISSQNCGYTVVPESIQPKAAKALFVNVNDKTNEGIRYENIPAFSVAFYPEAGGGTMDTSWLFDSFVGMMDGCNVEK